MSVIHSKEQRSALIRLLPEKQSNCCCVKTCLQIQGASLNSTLKPQTKDKLLSMISSLQKQYSDELEKKQTAYQEKIRELESTIGTMRLQSFELKQRSPEKPIIQVDLKREKELLDRIEQLEKQKNNVVSNKVSYIENTLTNKIHNLEHQMECQKLQFNDQLQKARENHDIRSRDFEKVIKQEREEKQKLKQNCQKLENDLNTLKNEHNITNVEKNSKIRQLDKEVSCLTTTIQHLKKQSDKLEFNWRERYEESKVRSNELKVELQKVSAQNVNLIIFQKEEASLFAIRSKQLEDELREEDNKVSQLRQQLNQKDKQIRKLQIAYNEQCQANEINIKNGLQKYESEAASREKGHQNQINILKQKQSALNDELASLKILILQHGQKEKQFKDRQDSWDNLYKEFQQKSQEEVEKLKAQKIQLSERLQFSQKELSSLLSQSKQKQYVYIQKLVHSQQGKLATQKYVSLTKQTLSLQSKLKDIELENKNLNTKLNYYKSLEATFSQEREKWKLEQAELIQYYKSKDQDRIGGFSWAVEKIIQAERNNEGVRVHKNVKVIPNENLPNISYVVVSNEQELSELVQSGGEMRRQEEIFYEKSREHVHERA